MYLSQTYKNTTEGVSIIIPVLNEAENVEPLVSSIISLPKNRNTAFIREVVFVDDGSTDGTQAVIREIVEKTEELRIKLIERDLKNGTVNAQLYGMENASYGTVVIMDGDLQHPASLIEHLIEAYLAGYDMVLASRYVNGGTTRRTVYHGLISRGANFLAKLILPWVMRIRDPISGFFIVNKSLVPLNLEMKGFNKLALYILTCRKNISVDEIPFNFTERTKGTSKVATGGTKFMLNYMRELRYYRHLRRTISGNQKAVSSPAEYELFRQH